MPLGLHLGALTATPTVLSNVSMTQTRPSGGKFGIASDTLVRSSQRPYMGLYGGRATPRRLRAGARTAGPGRRRHRRPGVIRVTAPIL